MTRSGFGRRQLAGRAVAVVVATLVWTTALPPASVSAWERSLTCFETASQNSFACETGQVPVPLLWSRSCVDYYVNVAGSAEIGTEEQVLALVQASFDAWNLPGESWLSLRFAGQTDDVRVGYASGCGIRANANLVTFVTSDWPSASRNVVALTSVTYDFRDGQIFDADVELNLTHYTWADITTPLTQRTVVDLQNTLTHEVGHFVGLDHTREETWVETPGETWQDATMFARTLPGETNKTTLTADDIAGLLAAYGDSTADVPECPAQGPAFVAASALEAPGVECRDEGCNRCATATARRLSWGEIGYVLLCLAVLRRRKRAA